jgi:hypothetical protein
MTQQTSQPPPPPGFTPGPEQPRKRKKWPWVLGGIALVMILGCVGIFALLGAGANQVAKSIDEADKNVKGQNAVAGKMNTPTKDGKFEFTVTGMKCGVRSVGPKELGQQAQGEFCLVDVTVKNVGTSAEMFDGSSQKAYDAKGAEYSHDGSAAIHANEQSQTFLQSINPGNQVKGKLIFDVPQGTKLTSVVMHESMLTAGVRVPLS